MATRYPRTFSDALVASVAKEFLSVIRDWCTLTQRFNMDQRNARRPAGANHCHSHDFCDANLAMAEAFYRHGLDPDDEKLSLLWIAAWSLAQAVGFATERGAA